MKERSLLQGIFRCSEKTDYDDVPNIHVALHYPRDLANYGNLKNTAVMIGEQKHKVFKAHSDKTNSKEREKQLLRAVNVNQTIR